MLFTKLIAISLLIGYVVGLPSKCGRSNGASTNWRIMGGQDASPGEFPWHVLLSMKSDVKIDNPDFDFCGGALISDRWVVTAAHCAVDIDGTDEPYDKDILLIRLGVHNYTKHEHGEFDFTNDKIVLFGDPDDIEHDIALIKLNETLDFAGKHSHLAPVCLALPNTNGTDCTATGFGTYDRKGHHHPPNGILQKISMHIQTDEYCTKRAGLYDRGLLICAGGHQKDGMGECGGDSGGPLQCRSPDGLWYLFGVLSFGPAVCGEANGVNGYAKVSHYSDWIHSTITNN